MCIINLGDINNICYKINGTNKNKLYLYIMYSIDLFIGTINISIGITQYSNF